MGPMLDVVDQPRQSETGVLPSLHQTRLELGRSNYYVLC